MKTFLIIALGVLCLLAGLRLDNSMVMWGGGLMAFTAACGYHPEVRPRPEHPRPSPAKQKAVRRSEAKL